LIERLLKETAGLILNLDIEVDKARFLSLSHLSPIQAVQTLGNPAVIVIDEAQRLPQASLIVKGWYDAHIANQLILLGSSSLNLLAQSAEPLTGRNEKIQLPPLLFIEILQHQPWYHKDSSSEILRQSFSPQLQSLYFQQMVFGSYPEVVITSEKERYLLNLVSDYLLKDVLQSSLIRSPETVRKLLMLLAYQVGSEVSVNELAGNLQVSRPTIERYLELLEQTFVIFRLPAFSTNQRKEIAKSSKIFFWDTGVRNALLKELSVSEYRSDMGALWENWVVSELAKWNLLKGQPYNLYFWRTTNGSEVDLIIKGTDFFRAYEIKWTKLKSPHHPSFTQRYGIEVEGITRDNFISHSPFASL
jgi:predicted AAA+ superfamily ATPase